MLDFLKDLPIWIPTDEDMCAMAAECNKPMEDSMPF